MQSIAAGGRDKFDDFVDFNMKQSAEMSSNDSGVSLTNTNKLVPMRGVLKAVLRANWRDEDLFQVPLLLSTVLKIDSDRSILNSSMDEEMSHRFKQLIVATMNNRPKVRKYKYDEYVLMNECKLSYSRLDAHIHRGGTELHNLCRTIFCICLLILWLVLWKVHRREQVTMILMKKYQVLVIFPRQYYLMMRQNPLFSLSLDVSRSATMSYVVNWPFEVQVIVLRLMSFD